MLPTADRFISQPRKWGKSKQGKLSRDASWFSENQLSWIVFRKRNGYAMLSAQFYNTEFTYDFCNLKKSALICLKRQLSIIKQTFYHFINQFWFISIDGSISTKKLSSVNCNLTITPKMETDRYQQGRIGNGMQSQLTVPYLYFYFQFVIRRQPILVLNQQMENIIITNRFAIFRMYYFMYSQDLAATGFPWSFVLPQSQQKDDSKKLSLNINHKQSYFTPTVLLNPLNNALDSSIPKPSAFKKVNVFQECDTLSKDGDYQPQKSQLPKSKKSRQLQNRNVVPNIIRLILSFIQKKGKSEKIVEHLLAKVGLTSSLSLKRFYLYQKLVRDKLNNYVNQDTLSKLCQIHPQEFTVYPEQEQALYNKITRVVISHFLRGEISQCALTSKRMQKSKRKQHMAAIRTIGLKLKQLLRY